MRHLVQTPAPLKIKRNNAKGVHCDNFIDVQSIVYFE
jgi:hypothetical protein